MEGAACFEHRPPARHLNIAVRVGNCDQSPPAPFNNNPAAARREGPNDKRGITPKQPAEPALHGLLSCDPFRAERIIKLGLRHSREPIKVPAHGDETNLGENRQQQSKCKKRQLQMAPPRAMALYELQAEAAMQPAWCEEADLAPLGI